MKHMVDELETFGGSLDDVRAFCTVMALGSVSAAARQLGSTKGGISRRVSRLERRLDVKLLARTPRRVSATEEGKSFHLKAREALALLEDAAEGARGSRSEPRGHLRVTASLDVGLDVLPALVVEFRALHPRITVELLVTDSTLDLAAHQVDLALRATVQDLPDMGYRASLLAEFAIALYATPDYLAAHAPPAAPAELARHDLVVADAVGDIGQVAFTHRRGREERVAVVAALRTSDYASAMRLVLAHGGIGALPDICASGPLAAGRLVRILPEWHVARARLHAISLGGRDAPARVRAFRDYVRERLGAMAAA